MSKTLLNVGIEKRGKKRKQANEESNEASEPVTEELVQTTQAKKKTKKQANGVSQKEDNEEQLIVQPNAKKVKLSSSLRPVSGNASAKGGSSASSSQALNKLTSVVYLGHLPKGFDEDEIRKFFNQFGKIKRMKLFRAKKSLASKGYAFLEFETEEIAKVVTEAMDGYFLMERKLVAQQLTADRVHDGLFLQKVESRLIKKITQLQAEADAQEEEEDEEVLKLIEKLDEEENQLVITEENFEQVYERHQQYTQKKQSQLTEKGVDYRIPIVSKTGEMIIEVKPLEVEEEEEKKKEEVEPVVKNNSVEASKAGKGGKETNIKAKKTSKQQEQKQQPEPVKEEKEEEDEEEPVKAAKTNSKAKKGKGAASKSK